MIINLLESKVKEALGIDSFHLHFTKNPDHGDFASNIALKSQNPKEEAAHIVDKLLRDESTMKILSKIEVAGAGFINFYLSKDFVSNALHNFVKIENKHQKGNLFENQKIIVEYTDPNPFKEFHVGHLYSNIVGEAIARLFESQGATVKRACYQGDVGMHVAKSIWGMREKLKEVSLENIKIQALSEKAKFLGQAYALGATVYEENENAKLEIAEINKKIFEKSDDVRELYDLGKEWSLSYFDYLYKRIGTKFDYYFFESEVAKSGKEIVLEFLKKGVFEESEGAIVFSGEKYGLHTRVFVNSAHLPTYEAKEMGLAPRKNAVFPYDLSIVVTANEINEYFKVVLKALELTFPELSKKTKHVSHGFVRLPEGKMSSRTGNIVSAESVLDMAKGLAINMQKEKEEKNAEKIGLAAIKYGFLKNNVGSDFEFDLAKSVSLTGNSGPYIQYTAVRAKSVLGKSKLAGEVTGMGREEMEIARKLVIFQDVLGETTISLNPSRLCTYLYELAALYNLYYDKVKIVGSERESVGIGITRAVCEVLTNGLDILGINVPDRM